MLDLVLALPFLAIGYLVGIVPTGYLVAKINGVDIRNVGSGNIGATNVLRAVGLGPAIFVAAMDPAKGALATLFPLALGLDPWVVALTGLATVVGNDFNVLLGFRGGKGVATSLGVFLVVNPLVTLVCTVLGIATIALGRYVSLGSLVGMLAGPLFLLARADFTAPELTLAIALVALAFVRHAENVRRLADGSERRLGERSAPRGGT